MRRSDFIKRLAAIPAAIAGGAAVVEKAPAGPEKRVVAPIVQITEGLEKETVSTGFIWDYPVRLIEPRADGYLYGVTAAD